MVISTCHVCVCVFLKPPSSTNVYKLTTMLVSIVHLAVKPLKDMLNRGKIIGETFFKDRDMIETRVKIPSWALIHWKLLYFSFSFNTFNCPNLVSINFKSRHHR